MEAISQGREDSSDRTILTVEFEHIRRQGKRSVGRGLDDHEDIAIIEVICTVDGPQYQSPDPISSQGRLTLHDMEVTVLVQIRIIVHIQDRRIPKVQPQKVGRQHPMPIPTRLSRAVDRLQNSREPALGDLVRRVAVDDPGYDGLEARKRLVEAEGAVWPWLAGRLGLAVVVVADDARRHVEGLDHGCHGARGCAAAKGRIEGIAAVGWVRAHPVVAGLLVGFDDDHVALAYIEILLEKPSKLTRSGLLDGGTYRWRYSGC